MPELPEVEHLRRTLARRLVGATVRRIEFRRADIQPRGARALTQHSGAPAEAAPPRGAQDETAHARASKPAVTGSPSFIGFGRHGKLLTCALDNSEWLLVHLGMSGQLLIADDEASLPRRDHVHVVIALENVRGEASAATRSPHSAKRSSTAILAFRDPRRFGGMMICLGADGVPHPWSEYGPDALTGARPTLDADALHRQHADIALPPDGEVWSRLFQPSRQSIKAALLDQRKLAGIGNIYADEILHAARIHPARHCMALARRHWRCLADASASILNVAIASGGSTFRDYVDSANRPGSYAAQHRVYGRTGQACMTCGATLRQTALGGRRSVYCPRCQRR